jgi:hypothetical protein
MGHLLMRNQDCAAQAAPVRPPSPSLPPLVALTGQGLAARDALVQRGCAVLDILATNALLVQGAPADVVAAASHTGCELVRFANCHRSQRRYAHTQQQPSSSCSSTADMPQPQ